MSEKPNIKKTTLDKDLKPRFSLDSQGKIVVPKDKDSGDKP